VIGFEHCAKIVWIMQEEVKSNNCLILHNSCFSCLWRGFIATVMKHLHMNTSLAWSQHALLSLEKMTMENYFILRSCLSLSNSLLTFSLYYDEFLYRMSKSFFYLSLKCFVFLMLVIKHQSFSSVSLLFSLFHHSYSHNLKQVIQYFK
jgi:hypothetical protein